MDFKMKSSSDSVKDVMMKQLREQAAVSSGKQLIEKVNENCFEKCIPKPGSVLSNGETSCLTQCMEKYMMMWSVIHRQYTHRISVEMSKSGAMGTQQT
ncbi:BgTH12-07732 [Blumeria graminis f. sp. triticale]|uniref:Mitochondrial import inner membrane translocase subunit n=2 Tax=Blumeria TaxID=34372 RepID=A0A383UKX4_BLUHO|nr:BgTH12-07732 [Blumeria graminis f. sp. triticale]SZF00923.1 unnamed protein product [Blumeria hordei]